MKFICFILSLLFFYLSLPSSAYGKENATWIKSTYLRGYDPITKKSLTSKDVESLALRLKENNIRYAYIFAGPYENNGHLPSYPFSQKAKESIAILKKIYPDLKILPWIGGVQNKSVHLERPDWARNAIADTAKLIKLMPFDGIHVDLEYVLYSDIKFNQKKIITEKFGPLWVEFHKQLRLALPNVFISSVVVSTASGTKPWKHKHSISEIKELSSVLDQLSFMFYETSLMEAKTYKESFKEQLQQIKELKSNPQNRSQYLIGLGVFKEEKKLQAYRDLGFENLPMTLKHLQELEHEINQKKAIIDGLSVYCEWMTSEREWSQLKMSLK